MKRGRKPILGRPMTTAEAKARSRAKYREEGRREVLIFLDERVAEKAKFFADGMGITMADYLGNLITKAMP